MQPFAKEAAPIVQNQIRPFVRDSRPVVRTLKQPANDLATSTPQLTRSFVVLNHLFNLIGYNPNGREGPDKSMNTGPNPREEGYLFWIAWLLHNGDSVFSTLRRQRPVPPDHGRRHVQHAQAAGQRVRPDGASVPGRDQRPPHLPPMTESDALRCRSRLPPSGGSS